MSDNLAKTFIVIAFLAFAAAGIVLDWNVWWSIAAFAIAVIVIGA